MKEYYFNSQDEWVDFLIKNNNPLNGLYVVKTKRHIIYSYYVSDKLHRLDGPAIEYSDGENNKYYINGNIYYSPYYYKEDAIDYYLKSNGLECYE